MLDASVVVNGGLTIRDASSRNRNAFVAQREGPTYFVKEEADPDREASVYRRLAAVPSLSRFLPAAPRSSRSGALLLLEVEAGSVDLWRHHLAEERFPVELAREVARALAALHRGTRLPSARPAPERAPPILRIHRPTVEALRELSPASIDLVKTIQGRASTVERLDRLRLGWEEQSLIHDDVKWPNILAVPSGDREPGAVRLVDWEHARAGDPAWDVGSALAAYLTFWLYSISVEPSATGPADLAAGARFPLGAMRPAIRALWEEYVEAAGIEAVATDELRRRSVALCAARLIRSAFEDTETQTTMSGRAALHLQVAVNVLLDPDAAARRLLGLSDDGAPAYG